tara:strand:+ start:692 stop:934 length:243 start_codon:yes stop_codon:yes gene_type:complete
MKTMIAATMDRKRSRVDRETRSIGYILSKDPVRLATIKYMTTKAMGTMEKAAATGGFRLMLEAMMLPIIWVAPPVKRAAR